MSPPNYQKLLPINLVNDIVLIGRNALTPEDYLNKVSLLVYDYFEIGNKLIKTKNEKRVQKKNDSDSSGFNAQVEIITKDKSEKNINVKALSGIAYYYNTRESKYITNKYLKTKNYQSFLNLERILSYSNINQYQILRMINKSIRESFVCIFIKDNIWTNRLFGVIVIILDSSVEKKHLSRIVEYSYYLKSFISKQFSHYLTDYFNKIKSKTYKDISLVRGFKEKIIFYEMLKGLSKVISFNHSATVYLFSPSTSKITVYAEKNSETNPKYVEDKKKYYGGEQFDLTFEEFNSIKNTEIITISNDSPLWLKRILSYKSTKIKNIILSKFIIPPKISETLDEHVLCGIIVVCNYTANRFSMGEIKILNHFLGINKKNEIENDSFLNFLNRTREYFLTMLPQLDLTKLNYRNLEYLVRDLEENIENYLTKLIPSINLPKGRKEKVSNVTVFFTTRIAPIGKFTYLPRNVQDYLLSESFLKEIDKSFYKILSSTKNKILQKKIFGKKWNTITIVRIPNSYNVECLCILREGYFDISYYDRLIIKFLSEHLALALSTHNSIEILKNTSECLQEIIKIGSDGFSLSLDEYMTELLDIAIKYTDSNKGNIFAISGNKETLELIIQNGQGEKITSLSIKNDKGVVTHVARNYLKFKDEPFGIDNIPDFINHYPDIGYIRALSNMKSELTIPLLLGEDLWGILNVESDKIRNYDEQKKYILSNIGHKASEIWQQRQLSYALEQTGIFLQSTIEESSLTIENPNIYKVCERQITPLLNIIIRSTSAHSATVRFLDDSANTLILYSQSDKGIQSPVERVDYNQKPNCVVFSAIKLGRVIDIPNLEKIDRKLYPNIEYFETKAGTKAEYTIPLRYAKRVDGVLNIEGTHPFTKSEKLMYRTISRLIEILLIQRLYLMRKQNFDQTSLISLGLHQLEASINFINTNLAQLEDPDKNNIEILKEIRVVAAKAHKLIKPLRIPGIVMEPIAVSKLINEIKLLPTYGNDIKYPRISRGLLDCYIIGNLEQLRNIFKDLLDNAYRLKSNVKVGISIKKKWTNSLQILIKNNGDGIDENIRDKLFKVPIDRGKISMGCFICGIILGDLGGRAYILETGKKGTIIGIDIPYYIKKD